MKMKWKCESDIGKKKKKRAWKKVFFFLLFVCFDCGFYCGFEERKNKIKQQQSKKKERKKVNVCKQTS